jgi:hypothetical protein
MIPYPSSADQPAQAFEEKKTPLCFHIGAVYVCHTIAIMQKQTCVVASTETFHS